MKCGMCESGAGEDVEYLLMTCGNWILGYWEMR